MKALKITLITLSSLFVVFYLAFLTILPNFVDINKYSDDLNKAVQDSCGFQVSMKKMKLYTKWNLSLGAELSQVDLKYPSGEKFVQANNLKVGISLPYLLLKQIKISELDSEKLILRLKVKPDGTFLLEDFLSKTEENQPKTFQEMPFGLTFSENMPEINLKKYSLSLVNTTTNKFYTLKGEKFRISDFVLGKKIKAEVVGSWFFDKRKQVNLDVKVLSKVFPDMTLKTPKPEQPQRINIIDILDKLYKLNFTSDIKSDIVIFSQDEAIKLDGDLDITNLGINLNGGKRLPKSNIGLKFDGNKININSNIYTDTDEFANLNGFFRYGKRPFINLKLKTDKTDLSNLFLMTNSVLSILGNNDFVGIRADGHVNADFSVKSDLKKIQSQGYLKIDGANIFYDLYNIALKNIIANIDFSSNQINIKKATANLNNAPIEIKGAINSDAYANILVEAQNLPLKGILATLAQYKMLKENDIYSGDVSVNAYIKGVLNKATPHVNVVAKNISLRNKPNKANVRLNNMILALSTDGKIINGKMDVNNLKITMPQMPVISVPKTKLVFNEKDFKITQAYMLLNNSKIDFFGDITDYANNKSSVNITAKGLMYANDIKSFLPREYRSNTVSRGKLPLVVKISGNSNVQDINAQMLANQNNFISVLDIKSLSGKTSLLNASMKLSNNTLKIFDISLNALNVNKGLSDNFKANLSNSYKVAVLKGSVSNLSSKVQQLHNISINIPSQVSFSVPMLRNSFIQAKADLNVNGTTSNPQILGQISIPYASIPTYQTVFKNTTTTLNKNTININCNQLIMDESKLAFNAVVSNNFNRGINIKSVDLNGKNIDLDSLLGVLAKLPQNANAPGTNLGITLSNGKGKVETFKVGGIRATNVNSDFVLNNNLLKLYNMSADAYLGRVVGSITYNILYSRLGINLQGRGLNAKTAVSSATGISNPLNGTLDFDATNLTMRGITETQLMRSLRGNATFIVSNGQMGTLGKLENLLYAQNIVNSIFKTSLGAITKAVSIKKTGDFKYIKGRLSFANGWCNIQYIQTSGPAMSMYMYGKYNLLSGTINAVILGRLSNDVVSLLGPIGDFSFNKLISSIPRFGQITSNIINQLTTDPQGENLSMLPQLTPVSMSTKEFKVAVNGLLGSRNSVTYFKWLATPTAATATSNFGTATPINQAIDAVTNTVKQEAQNTLKKVLPTLNVPSAPTTVPTRKQPTGVADFINSLPELRK